jgi:ATP-dependent RNA helicase RhlE
MNFDSFAFRPQINAGLARLGYTSPTPIQLRAIPPILEGRDVLGLAQTGTGKTAAFVLPILEHLMSGPRRQLRALILSPTRELAEQTHTVINGLGYQTKLFNQTIYGGVKQQKQVIGLQKGAEIAVACPGRLLDLVEQHKVDLSHIEVLVIDEADRLFDMGFLPDIKRIVRLLPAKRQVLLFSATMPKEIRRLADEFLKQPVVIEIGSSKPVATVSHMLYPVEQAKKSELLLALLRRTGQGQVLIFTRTKHKASKLAMTISKAGFSASALHGNLSQNQRQHVMDGFRSGRLRILVATDIAARGIDVTQISHVVNFDMPDTAEAYTHRIGRTGRMERQGAALSLVTRDDQTIVQRIERMIGRPIERTRFEGQSI